MDTLQGKVVVVTGAAKRMGRSIALDLAGRGARVAIHYKDSAEEARATAAACGGRTFCADLAKVSEIRQLFLEIARTYSRLDCLVNNAAVFRAVDPLEATEEDSVVARFLEKRGEGIHHIAIEVDNLQDHLDRLKEKNVKLIDRNPRLGAQGRLIAFIHPESTGGVLIELSQPVE